MTEFFEQIGFPNTPYSVIIEDDGKVAYGYLLMQTDIIGDVWLYNQDPTPENSYWKKENMPFLNPSEYVKTGILFSPIISKSHLKLNWSFSTENKLEKVDIFYEGKILAILKPGSKPGWSALAEKDGPLAMALR